MSLPDYTEADVLRWFGAHQPHKARPCVDAAANLRVNANLLAARVAGTAPRPDATRAHRIGQTGKVFVSDLLIAGSIEKKFLALRAKKAELAASILAQDRAAGAEFGESGCRA